MTLSVGTRLGPYEILAPLGAGGMGEVYRARDSKLDRDVAVKVLPQSLTADADALARFEREAKAIAALSHPNILAIHDFGNQDGATYAVMELLDGETLGAKLATGPITQKQAVDYARQVAKGLSAAHEKGIVHRDLKPENLFVSKDGHLKILDFGLSKKIEAVSPDEETSAPTGSAHTEAGTVMGTMGYMSPEQVRGQPVDHRSDIFSFGTILYEMLSGRKAFKKDTASDTMAAILLQEPPELTESNRNVSPALDHIVKHCLEKDRDTRFQTAKDIAFALSEQSWSSVVSGTSGAEIAPSRSNMRKVLVGVAAVVVLAAVGVVLLRRPHRGEGQAGGVKRVAVLPFENLGSPDDDYFADGIADAIRGKLTSLPGVEVIARESSTPYKKTTKTPSQIAQELDVGYLLTATVRWQKAEGVSRVHVTPELVEVRESGATADKWQQPFDATITDVFLVQSAIATQVAQALGGALGGSEEKRLLEKPTQSVAAYDAFLKAEEIRYSGASDILNLRKEVAFYEEAVALDPGFAQAWAGVSFANSSLYSVLPPSPQLAERARQAGEKAISLAPSQPEGYLSLGTYERIVSLDFTGSMEQFEQGLRVAPGDARLLRATAVTEESLGRWEAALQHFRQAVRLDPRSVKSQLGIGHTLLLLRRYMEARESIVRCLALAPADLALIEYKAISYLGSGDLAGAQAVLTAAPKDVEPTALVAFMANKNDLVWVLGDQQRDVLLRLPPSAFDDDRGTWALCLVQAYALKGDVANAHTSAEEARKAIEEQLRATPGDPQSHVNLGLALAYLGRKEQAIREGEHGVALDPVSKDSQDGPYYQHQLVRIYMLVGEPEKALDELEPLLKIPYYLSPGWLAIDPNFDPLRKNPRFQKLVAGAK